jgi:predicted RNA-binding protein YlqC (UPF0109 family)
MTEEIQQIKQIVEKYIQTIAKLLYLDFEAMRFETEEKNNLLYVYVSGKNKDIAFLIGQKGRTAIAVRRILGIILRKEGIKTRVKLVFGKK